jgi:hypothetical protein
MLGRGSRCKIKEKLEYLQAKLPDPPTVADGLYSMPPHFRQAVLDTKFSQGSLQKLSDHMGYFLGLLSNVQVRIGIESSQYLPSTGNRSDTAERVGLYKVSGGHREIQLTKRFHFAVEHILAILAHESTHRYLYEHGVSDPEESENEILTDLAAAYLGFGALLLDGYEPITWTSNYRVTWEGTSYTTHSILIGYVDPEYIRYAILESAKLRKLPQLATILTPFQRFLVSSYLRRIARRDTRQKTRIEALIEKTTRLNSLYAQLSAMMKQVSSRATHAKISPRDGRVLVEIANALSLGQIPLAIERLLRDATILKDGSNISDSDTGFLFCRAAELSKTITYWHRVVSKYVR